MRQLADRLCPGGGHVLLSCAANAYGMWDGGNQWSGYPAWLSFFRHVVGLGLDYSKWQHYEAAALHGGPRVMHKEFCIVSDRPYRLLVDQQNRPHSADGPFCAWRDGTALWAWHGVRVPAKVIMAPQTLTHSEIAAESNAEVRRVMIERYGWERWLLDSGAKPVQSDRFGDLYRTEIGGAVVGVVVVQNSTPEPTPAERLIDSLYPGSMPKKEYKRYALLVPPEHHTAHSAVASTFGMTADEYNPVVET